MVQIAQSIAKDTMIVLMVIMPAVLVEGRYVWLVILILATTALKVSAHAFLIICIYLSFSFSSFFSSVSPINFVFNILLCFSSLLSLFFYFHLSPSLSLSLSLSPYSLLLLSNSYFSQRDNSLQRRLSPCWWLLYSI